MNEKGYEIVKAYRQSVPAMRFIGKKYGDSDRVKGGFGFQWGQWFQNGWFEVIEKSCGQEKLNSLYEDGGAYIGLMRHKDGEPFEYWIGIFAPASAIVPEGFGYIDFPAADLGTCWVKGKENKIYCHEGECAKRLNAEGMELASDGKSTPIGFFERYGCPRFTTPDENGEIILDICFFIK